MSHDSGIPIKAQESPGPAEGGAGTSRRVGVSQSGNASAPSLRRIGWGWLRHVRVATKWRQQRAGSGCLPQEPRLFRGLFTWLAKCPGLGWGWLCACVFFCLLIKVCNGLIPRGCQPCHSWGLWAHTELPFAVGAGAKDKVCGWWWSAEFRVGSLWPHRAECQLQ